MKKKLATFMGLLALLVSLNMAHAAKKDFQGIINVNSASAEELMQLPGIGKSKADAIIAYRQSHPFKSVSELTEVKGIGPKMLEKIQSHISIDGNSTASTSVTNLPTKVTK
ncbi:MAG: helix-hairpin-helix domain-containing protein [Deltaproteobacteria bacterium]|nr:MAG: helix-hairpin-helix domain-containing protein [Deltaproteobacteria bacterium]